MNQTKTDRGSMPVDHELDPEVVRIVGVQLVHRGDAAAAGDPAPEHVGIDRLVEAKADAPGEDDLIEPTRTERAAPDVTASRSVSGTGSVPVARAATTKPAPPTYYRVKRGDTLSKIARLFDTSVAKLKAWNRLRTNTITAGSRLVVRAR